MLKILLKYNIFAIIDLFKMRPEHFMTDSLKRYYLSEKIFPNQDLNLGPPVHQYSTLLSEL